MALAILVDKLISALDKGEYAVGIFLDFSKAFDTVDHFILLKKLSHYGIRGSPLSWFQSYLQDRTQCVRYNDTVSKHRKITCGVPQGSILGPLLFLIYLNDLALVSPRLFTLLFADDSNLFMTGSNLHEIQTNLNIELQKIDIWLKSNKLSVNIGKTHYMLFSPRKRVRDSDDLSLYLGNKEIARTYETKFLGVIIDSGLSWKAHIQYICKKVSKGIGILYKAKRFLNRNTLINLYYTFIYPYLSYCNHVWGSAKTTFLQPLYVLQKRALKIIFCLSRRTSTEYLFSHCKIMPLYDINKYLICMSMYKCHDKQCPRVFQDLFTINEEIHSYNTRLSKGLHIPKIVTERGKTSLRYRGPYLWNAILSYTTIPNTEYSFKKLIKSMLLTNNL